MIEQINRLLALPDTPRYNIKAVVQQTQVNVSTLRAWEQRYGVPCPTRSDHGHRLYSQRDVEIIKWLKQCTEEGLAISQAVAMLRDINEHGDLVTLRIETQAPAPEPEYLLTGQAGWHDMRLRLSEALVAVNLRQAHLLVNTAVTLFPLETIVLELFEPMLVESGMRWSRGEMCVAQEHLITNFIRQRLLALTQLYAPFSHGRRLICACAPGELHEIGLLMFALLMEQRGWEVVYIGQSLELAGFADFLVPLAPAVVALSASMVEHVTGMFEAAVMVESLKSHNISLVFGGRAFDRHPELRQRFPGTFLGNDLRAAVVRAEAVAEDRGQERRLTGATSPIHARDADPLPFGF